MDLRHKMIIYPKIRNTSTLSRGTVGRDPFVPILYHESRPVGGILRSIV